MTKRDDEVRAFITKRAGLWQERLGLGHFDIYHVFVDDFYGEEDVDSIKTVAKTVSRWNYFEAKVTWYLPSAARHDDDYLERTLVHELCHVLLCAEQEFIPERHHEKCEMTTEMVTRAVWRIADE